MPRVKLDLPKQFHFTIDIPVRISDINYGGHLGNDSLLTLMHEAPVQFLRQFDYTEMNVEGSGTIIANAVLVYIAEAFYNDVLRFDIAVNDFHAAGCDITYRITNAESGKEIARAKTGIVFFDYAKRKVVAVPERFKERFFSPDT